MQNTPKNIPVKEWLSHFKNLMGEPNNNETTNDFEKSISNYIKENQLIFNQLNFRITDSEITRAILLLKNNKSPGTDGIINEFLKAGKEILLPCITKLFNSIFNSGIYPSSWRVNTLTPIYKKGDRNDPINYRGIAVSSSLSKLFCSVLNRRLSNFLYNDQIIPINQIGFRKGYRTADHILSLKTLIEKYISQNKYIYVTFIDFRAAFDSVWRIGMIYKLIKCGVGGNFIKILINIYSKVKYCIKLPDGLSEEFTAHKGLKQGCVMSPNLFNVFLNDLPAIFDISCHPCKLNNIDVSCLLYADDLVLFSESQEGHQNALDKLHTYCSKWKLSINTTKTKTIIFNKSGKFMNKYNFIFADIPIETVKTYRYLGIDFTASGSFSMATNLLKDKALKALFTLKQSNIKGNIKLSFKFFNSLILPILSYCSEIWSPFHMKNINKSNLMKTLDNNPLENIHLKFFKYLLGVHRKSCNAAVRGELGSFPIAINFLTQSLKYWSRLTMIKSNSLIYHTYAECLTLHRNKNNNWISHIHTLLTYLKLDNFWKNQQVPNAKQFIRQVNKITYEEYKQEWKISISNNPENNKLQTYAKFKTNFEMENYLIHLNSSQKKTMFTKLRISSHDLHIETGRYTKPRKTPVNDRICRFCSTGEIEDELHFTLNCEYYSEIRKDFYNKLESFCDFRLLDAASKLITLFSYNNGDTEFCDLFVEFLNNCYEKRN